MPFYMFWMPNLKMGKANKELSTGQVVITIVLGIIVLAGVVINLPFLQYNVKDFGATGELSAWNPKITPVVWNTGPMVVGASIFAPLVCISITVDQNIPCSHSTIQNSQAHCENPVCQNVSKGNFFSQDFSLNLEKSPKQFDFNVLFDGKVTLLYTCGLFEDQRKYDCNQLVQLVKNS